jgi:hypothetical protein
MPEKENKEITIHEDIPKKYYHPYWEIYVSRKPKYPADRYTTPVRNWINNDEIINPDDLDYVCAHCKSEDIKLLFASEFRSNAGDEKEYEFLCRQCGVYSIYIEKDFS